jgi:hypothetical protein
MLHGSSTSFLSKTGCVNPIIFLLAYNIVGLSENRKKKTRVRYRYYLRGETQNSGSDKFLLR